MPKFIDLTGRAFGKLIVLGRSNIQKDNKRISWDCHCQCGNNTVVVVSGTNLTSGNTKSCGCIAKEFLSKHEDLTGKVYGRLVVVKECGRSRMGKITWLCKCACGSSIPVIVSGRSLKTGNTKSCGCYRKDILTRKWEPIDIGDCYKIPLTKGKFSIIDKDDLLIVSKYSWSVSPSGYAVARDSVNKSKNNVRMHRLILGLSAQDSRMSDHINHDTLDNRRCNLRAVSLSDNVKNSKKRSFTVIKEGKIPSSKYIGVSFNKKSGHYTASVKISGKRIFLGEFSSEEDAAKERDKMAKSLSDCYNLNFK